jgi:hypothetical protein
MCCGQKRTELRNSQTQRTTPSAPQYGPANSRAPAVRIQSSAPPANQAASPHQLAQAESGSVQTRAASTTSTPHALIGVRYLDNSPIRVRGLVSGSSYEFSNARPVQQVDARDASALLNTRFFRRA